MTTTTKTTTPKIWVGSLSHYNAGHLVGEWLEINPRRDGRHHMTLIYEVLQRAEENGPDVSGPVEEYIVCDYEGFPSSLYSEYMGNAELGAVCSFARAKERHGEAFNAYSNIFGEDVPPEDWGRDFEERFVGVYSSVQEFGIEWAEIYGFDLDGVPSGLTAHIDFEGWIRANTTPIVFERIGSDVAFFRQHV